MPRNQECLTKLKCERKSAIISSGLFLFSFYGYEGITIDDISKKSGLKRSLIYHYFKSKEDIFHSVMEYTFNEISKRAELDLEGEKTPFDRLEALVSSMRNLLIDENDDLPCMLYLLLNMHLRKEMVPKPKKIKDIKDDIHHPILLKYVNNAIVSKQLKIKNAKEPTIALLSMFQGLAFNRICLGKEKFICPSLKIMMNVFQE